MPQHQHPLVRQRTSGFTLVEMLVTIALLAIVSSLAVPAFTDTVRRHRAATQTNTFLAELNTARSEATRTRRVVVMCPRANADACNGSSMGQNGCACDDGNQWENGWLMFVDMDSSGSASAGDSLVSIASPLAGDYTLRRDGGGSNFFLDASLTDDSRVAFRGRGTLLGPAATFSLCASGEDEQALEHARFVEVALSGRAGVRAKTASETTRSAACLFGASS